MMKRTARSGYLVAGCMVAAALGLWVARCCAPERANQRNTTDQFIYEGGRWSGSLVPNPNYHPR